MIGWHRTLASLTVVVCLLAGCRKAATPDTLIVSAAASFQDAMEELSQAFTRTYGPVRIVHNAGASSTLARQILAGAPCDVMISADQRQLKRLQSAGVVEHTADIAAGRLVMVGHGSTSATHASFEELISATDGLIAIGDAGVPVGEYARGFISQGGYESRLRSRLVPHRNARHVLATVRAGNADFGFVYETDARAEPGVTTVFTPGTSEVAVIIYPAAVLTSGRNATAGRRFVDWMQSEEAQKILLSHGFGPVGD